MCFQYSGATDRHFLKRQSVTSWRYQCSILPLSPSFQYVCILFSFGVFCFGNVAPRSFSSSPLGFGSHSVLIPESSEYLPQHSYHHHPTGQQRGVGVKTQLTCLRLEQCCGMRLTSMALASSPIHPGSLTPSPVSMGFYP